jgi:hypothetical protein
MKRIVTKEVFIQIETVRVTRKRRVRQTETPKSDASNHGDSTVILLAADKRGFRG